MTAGGVQFNIERLGWRAAVRGMAQKIFDKCLSGGQPAPPPVHCYSLRVLFQIVAKKSSWLNATRYRINVKSNAVLDRPCSSPCTPGHSRPTSYNSGELFGGLLSGCGSPAF